MTVARIFLGFDSRERHAYEVAHYTLSSRASCPLLITPLRLSMLEQQGIMWRTRKIVGTGKAVVMWDNVSKAPMSTEFAISRFAAVILAQTGWVAFMDSDIVALGDVAGLFSHCDPRFAVMCVKHGELIERGAKMDGQPQLPYPRKNWSSVMLFNCDHPSNRWLTLGRLNRTPGRDLHRFCWLRDEEIGALPLAWNWLVNVEPCPDGVKLAHFTLGGPWLPDWSPREHDDIFVSASQAFRSGLRAGDPGRSPPTVQT